MTRRRVSVDLSKHPSGTPLGMLLAPAFSQSQLASVSRVASSGAGTSAAAGSSPNASSGEEKLTEQTPAAATRMSTDEAEHTVIAGWERLPSGKLGPVQRCGTVRIGDRLVAVNGVDVASMNFRRIMTLLKSASTGTGVRTLTFVPHVADSDDKSVNTDSQGQNLNSPLQLPIVDVNKSSAAFTSRLPFLPQRYTFRSTICRARIQNDSTNNDANTTSSLNSQNNEVSSQSSSAPHSRQFVEYEVACCLVIRGITTTLYNNKTTTKTATDSHEQNWTVWKRFSEFQQLDKVLRDAYGWQINALQDGNGVPFPSAKPFSSWFSKLSPSFVEQRRNELEIYWQTLLQVEEMTDFAHPHRCSADLASFLLVDQFLPVQRPSPSSLQVPSNLGLAGHLASLAASSLYTQPTQAQSQPRRSSSSNLSGHAAGDEAEARQYYTEGKNTEPRDLRRQRIRVKSAFQRRIPGTFVSIMLPPPAYSANASVRHS